MPTREELLERKKELLEQLAFASRAWDEGTDPFAMAENDPGLQFEMSMELENIEKQLTAMGPAIDDDDDGYTL